MCTYIASFKSCAKLKVRFVYSQAVSQSGWIRMLTYATIFIVSIVVAVVALVFYRFVSESSKSVLSSKGPISLVTPSPQNDQSHRAVTGTPASLSPTGRAVPANVARPAPAIPTRTVDWGWEENGNQVREQHPHHSKGAVGSKHCSLYDVDPTAPPKRDVTWPHREEKLETGGTAYKVTRKGPSGNPPS